VCFLLAIRWFVEGGDGEEDDQADEAGGPDYFADDADVEEHADAGGIAHGLQESGDPNEDGSDDRQGDREGEERFGGGAESHWLGDGSIVHRFRGWTRTECCSNAPVFAQGASGVNATGGSQSLGFRLIWAGCDASCGCAALVGATSATQLLGIGLVTLTGCEWKRQWK
jgi:hypothetical protein